ncbi:MAG: hypothetical protein KIS76_08065 [Pyrinomonadaceae bacterium]|nr:hypothetical protein [Pyrinomonadaceae bacterium]
MKNILLSFLAVAISAIAVKAQCDITTINLQGDDYTVCKELPKEILGIYKYEEKGEPIIEIRDDGTGRFQPHGVPAIPIKIWIDVDEKGIPRREVGTEQRYRYTLLIQYGAGGGGNYPEGKYDLLDVTMLKDQGIAMILGERIRRL